MHDMGRRWYEGARGGPPWRRAQKSQKRVAVVVRRVVEPTRNFFCYFFGFFSVVLVFFFAARWSARTGQYFFRQPSSSSRTDGRLFCAHIFSRLGYIGAKKIYCLFSVYNATVCAYPLHLETQPLTPFRMRRPRNVEGPTLRQSGINVQTQSHQRIWRIRALHREQKNS